MAERRRRITIKLVMWLIVFGAGVAVGFYVRDQQQHERIQEAVEQARREVERASEEMMERGRRAGEGLRAGAQAAADSTRAAVREMLGDTAH
jgi:uncharacterized protein HemX